MKEVQLQAARIVWLFQAGENETAQTRSKYENARRRKSYRKVTSILNRDRDRGNVSVVESHAHVRVLTEELASVEGVAWSPSGEEVWVGGAANIQSATWSDTVYAVNLKGKMRPIVRLPGIVRLHDISKDGRILISMEAWRTQLVGFFSGDKMEHPYSWLDWSVSMGSSLSRHGRQLLFTEAGGAATDEFVPYLSPTDGSPAVRLAKVLL
jgi:hypothetical protein